MSIMSSRGLSYNVPDIYSRADAAKNREIALARSYRPGQETKRKSKPSVMGAVAESAMIGNLGYGLLSDTGLLGGGPESNVPVTPALEPITQGASGALAPGASATAAESAAVPSVEAMASIGTAEAAKAPFEAEAAPEIGTLISSSISDFGSWIGSLFI